MWKLCVEDDQGNKTTVNLVRDEYAVGRGQENTVRLTERNISRRHALLRKNGTGWSIEDQSSYNGCFVNGARVCDPQPLEHGDLIQLGDYRLRMVNESAEALDDKTPPARPQRGPGALAPPLGASTDTADRLVMLVGPTPGAEFALENQRVVVGRGEECDISINHNSVSREHAEINRLADGTYEIIDKGSANGIRVNGNDLRRSLLESHDTVELGDIVFKFIPGGEDFVPPPVVESPLVAPEVAGAGLVAEAELQPRARLTSRQLQVVAAVAGLVLAVAIGVLLMRSAESTPTEVATPSAPPPAAEPEPAPAPAPTAEVRQGSSPGIDVNSIPTTEPEAAKPPPAPGEEAAVQPTPRKTGTATPTRTTQPAGKPVAAAAEPEAPKPAAAPAPAVAPDKATSGDRGAQLAVKDGLKAKVAAGTATDKEKRLLRALCRQYGDPSCAN